MPWAIVPIASGGFTTEELEAVCQLLRYSVREEQRALALKIETVIQKKPPEIVTWEGEGGSHSEC